MEDIQKLAIIMAEKRKLPKSEKIGRAWTRWACLMEKQAELTGQARDLMFDEARALRNRIVKGEI